MTWTLRREGLGRTFELVDAMAENDTEYGDIWKEWGARRRREIESEYGIKT